MMDGKSGCGLWAMRELGWTELGDKRRTQRLVKIAEGLASEPGRAMSSSCGKNGAQAVSRLMGRDEVTCGSVLEGHCKMACERCREYDMVLAVQDTTYLDFSGHPSTEGLGPIGDSKESRGICCHSVLILSPNKTPLGLAGMNLWERDAERYGISETRRKRPIQEKESNKWLLGLEQAQEHTPPECLVLAISDRESDVYEYFTSPRRDNVHLLVRLEQNRRVVTQDLEDEDYILIRKALENAPVAGQYEIYVPGRTKAESRTAKLEVRLTEVDIMPPVNPCSGAGREPVHVWLVWAHELDAPDGVDALDWKLATTICVEGFEGALFIIEAYSGRWVIEEFHRVLKSGCKVEKMQFDDVESLEPAIAASAVVAYRLLYLTKIARESPDADVSLVASPIEVQVAQSYMKSQREKDLYEITTVAKFVRAVALMGGFMGRKGDGNPGTKVLWQGVRRLWDLVDGYKLGFAAAELNP